jgi:hypothetical protein
MIDPPAAAPDGLRSITDVCEVDLAAGAASDPVATPDLLIEVPHGATRESHFRAVRDRLVGELPSDLVHYFFVNTDVGAPECASHVAQLIAAASPLKVIVLRGLVPRTFVDCNRVVDGGPNSVVEDGLTPGLPGYIRDPADVRTLVDLHRTYHDVARHAYDLVCGNGGLALMLHSYAPRSVRIDDIDDGIVRALHRAYEPASYEMWEERPDVDVIAAADDDTQLASATWIDSLVSQYAAIGIRVAQNATYRLHPGTMGHRYSARFPGRALCLELNRALLADPFSPFEEMRIGEKKVQAMSEPIAAASLEELERR